MNGWYLRAVSALGGTDWTLDNIFAGLLLSLLFRLRHFLLLVVVIILGDIGVLGGLVEIAHIPLEYRVASIIAGDWLLLLYSSVCCLVHLICFLSISGNECYFVVPIGLRSVHARIFLLIVDLFHGLDSCC